MSGNETPAQIEQPVFQSDLDWLDHAIEAVQSVVDSSAAAMRSAQSQNEAATAHLADLMQHREQLLALAKEEGDALKEAK